MSQLNQVSRYAPMLFVYGALVLFPVASTASPTQWTTGAGGNGHYYEVVLTEVRWPEARIAAEQREWPPVSGNSGYLATITSWEENEFIENNFLLDATFASLLIGGFQPPDFPEPPYDEGWEWVTPEPWGFTNWAPGEPNNLNYEEDELQIYSDFDVVHGPLGTWNDIPGAMYVEPYLVEYMPEPATLSLLALGSLILPTRRR